MEFLIVGGIAILGYEINKAKYRENNHIEDDYDGEQSLFPFGSSYEIRKNNKNIKNKVHKHIHKKNTIGSTNTNVFDGPHNPKPFDPIPTSNFNFNKKEGFMNEQPTLKPFFSSEKTQNTNDDFKNRRLSMFTGIENNDEYQHKKETKQLFSPEETKERSLTNHLNIANDKDKYIASTFKTNELPFKQKMIGRGIGIDPSKSADGGFHSQFRILPNNVNDYKKNSFEGRVIYGKNNIDKRQKTEQFREFDKTICQETRPTMPIKAIVNAQSINTNNSIQKCTDRGNTQKLNNIKYNAFSGSQTYTMGNSTRNNDSTQGASIGNPMCEKMGTGGYTTSSYLTHETERENCGLVTNLMNTSQGIYTTNNDKMKPTLRTANPQQTHYGQISNNQEKYGIDRNISNNNIKAVKNVNNKNYIGIMSSNFKADIDRNINIPISKNELLYRKQINQQNTIQGVKQVPYHENLPDQYKLNYNKENLSTSFTPGMSRINVLQDPNKANGMTMYKNDTNNTINPNISGIKSINNFTNSNNMGYVQIDQTNKQNDRIHDFKILQNQLKNNPYNHNILNKHKV